LRGTELYYVVLQVIKEIQWFYFPEHGLVDSAQVGGEAVQIGQRIPETRTEFLCPVGKKLKLSGEGKQIFFSLFFLPSPFPTSFSLCTEEEQEDTCPVQCHFLDMRMEMHRSYLTS
jgi:hypothetical protein